MCIERYVEHNDKDETMMTFVTTTHNKQHPYSSLLLLLLSLACTFHSSTLALGGAGYYGAENQVARRANPSEVREMMRGRRSLNRDENDLSRVREREREFSREMESELPFDRLMEARERAFARAMEAKEASFTYQSSFDMNEQKRMANPAEVRSKMRKGVQTTQRIVEERIDDERYDASYKMKQERDEIEREIDQFEQERKQKEQDVIDLEREHESLQEELDQIRNSQFVDQPRSSNQWEPSFDPNEKGKGISPAEARNMMRAQSNRGDNQRSNTARRFYNDKDSTSRRQQSQFTSRIDMKKKAQNIDYAEVRRSMRGDDRVKEGSVRRTNPSEARKVMRGEKIYKRDEDVVQIYEPTILKRTQNTYPANSYYSKQQSRDRRESFDANRRSANSFENRDTMRGNQGPPYANRYQNFQPGPWNEGGAFEYDNYQYPQYQRRDRSVSFDMNRSPNRANPADARDSMRGYQSAQSPYNNYRNYQPQRVYGNGANVYDFYQRRGGENMAYSMNDRYGRQSNSFMARGMMRDPQGPPYTNSYRYQGPSSMNNYQGPPFANGYQGPPYSNGYRYRG